MERHLVLAPLYRLMHEAGQSTRLVIMTGLFACAVRREV